MKKAEDDDGLIFRFYEFEGKPAQVKLELPQKAVSAVETNLMEKHQGAVKLGADSRSLSLQTGPYEIRTVEVSFAQGK
jgi:alpha-mannosidase